MHISISILSIMFLRNRGIQALSLNVSLPKPQANLIQSCEDSDFYGW